MEQSSLAEADIAVLIPCYNEAATVGKVVDDFRSALPNAKMFVFDNCSTDDTAEIARRHGATVIREPRKGKGYVIEQMFGRVDADYFIMVDGDDTYPADRAAQLLEPVLADRCDMAVGARLANATDDSFRPLHVAGNQLVRRLVNHVFGAQLTDIMSGYRAFNRRVVEQLPIVSSGFEVETAMTVHLLYYGFSILEVPVHYQDRPEGSFSKLRTFHDGFRVLGTIFSLFRTVKPLTFFGLLGIFLALLSVLAGIPPVVDYFTEPEHYVHHVPLAILAAALMLLAFGNVFLGILLHSINWRLKELHNVTVRSGWRATTHLPTRQEP